jgi:MFS family permease
MRKAMLQVLSQAIAPLLSLFIFILGNGFFSTLLALNMNMHNEPALLIGAMTGFYYAGIVCGSFRVEHFIVRVGHIRAFSTFASALAVISLLHGIFYQMYFWLFLRFIGGIATAGLFIVIESWLLCKSTHLTRGRVLSLYMITFYAAQAIGQFLINIGKPSDLLLYAIATMLCSLSVIPLSMTYVRMPEFEEPSTMKFKDLYKNTASGLFGCFCAGMILSAIYGLFPILFADIYHDKSTVALLMFCLIMGGMTLQYPVGKLSDLIERRLVVILISCMTIITCIGLILAFNNYYLSIILITLFGGLTFTIYPVSISYACDALDTKDIVTGIQTLLLAYSIGATLGPFIAPLFMHKSEIFGLFIYFILINGFIGALFLWRKTQKLPPPHEEPFQVMPQTTPIMAELDPRTEENSQS